MSRKPVAYIRRSVARKSDPGDISRSFQTAKVRELAGDDGPTLVVIDQDWGRSAARDKTDKRLAFLDLLASIERGEVSTVYAYSADRLARSVRWAAQLLDACEDAGTTIVTSEGRFPPGDTGARMVFQVLAIGNEHALTSIVQKSTSGIAARRARGDELGSFRYGYKTARQANGSIKWERDPDVPLDRVLDIVRANHGNILASCRDLDGEGIAPPKGGVRWGTSALTRIVDREEPNLRPRRTRTGTRRPTKSVLTGLVKCPTCDATMTPVSTREGIYCRFGSRDLGKFRTEGATKREGSKVHPKYFSKEHAILAMLHAATDGRTFTRYSFTHETTDAAAAAKAEERWRRANKRYQMGGISDEDYEREAAQWKAAQSASWDAEEGIGLDVKPGMAYVRWDEDAATVNADLRRLFTEIRLDPTTLAPIEAVWRNPRMAHRGAA